MKVQVPVAHEAAAFGNEQATPHAPQSSSVSVGVSQPLLRLESQSAYPVAQVGSQPFARQALVPCALLHVSSQLRQCSGEPSCVSQPSPLVQSANPEAQPVSTHSRLRQAALPFGK